MNNEIIVTYADAIEVIQSGPNSISIKLTQQGPQGQDGLKGDTGDITPEMIALRDETLAGRDATKVSQTAAKKSETNAANSASNATDTLAKINELSAQTKLDAQATAADRLATNADVKKTAADAVTTAADAVTTTSDRAKTGQDREATAADRAQTTADKNAADTSEKKAAASAAEAKADSAKTSKDAVATAADRVQTGKDVLATAADRIAANEAKNVSETNAATAVDSAASAERSKAEARLSAEVSSEGAKIATKAVNLTSEQAEIASAAAIQTSNDREVVVADKGIVVSAKEDAILAKNKAQEWASAPEGQEVLPGEFSSKHWAKKAEQSSSGGIKSINGKSDADITLSADDIGAIPDTKASEIESNTKSRHGHDNKEILDKIEQPFTTELKKKVDEIESGAQVNPDMSLYQAVKEKNKAGGYAGLNNEGKVGKDQLPTITINDVSKTADFTAEVGKSYWLRGSVTVSLPSAGLKIGDEVIVSKSLAATPTIKISAGAAKILTAKGKVTSIAFDVNAKISFVFNGLDWEV